MKIGSAGMNVGSAPAVTATTATTALSSDSSTTAAVTTPAVSSGAAFTPSTTKDTQVYIPIAATTTGTVTITMGPSTGTENTPVPVSNLVAASEPVFTLRVPKGWKVIVTKTGTTVAIGTVTVVTC